MPKGLQTTGAVADHRAVLPPDDRPPVPRSPSGRIPQWVLDEATDRPAADTRWRAAPGGRPPRRGLGVLSKILIGTAAAGLVVAIGSGAFGDLTSLTGPGVPTALPDAPDQGDEPLGQPDPVATTSGAWAPISVHDGEPVRWDPCRPIHFVVNPAGEPEGGRAVLDAALARTSAVTGLQFVDDGASDETERDSPVDQGWTGSRWAPVLVRWDLPVEETTGEDGVVGTVMGQAGPLEISTADGTHVYVSGSVGLTTAGSSYDPRDPAQAAAMEAVWLHELGHLVGLDHVEDPTQLMNPSMSGVSDYADGDLTGLATLGSGPCLAT